MTNEILATPHAIESELAVLSYMIGDDACWRLGRARLESDDFFDDANRKLFEAMVNLPEGVLADEPTLLLLRDAIREFVDDPIAFLGRVIAHGSHWWETGSILSYMRHHVRVVQTCTARRAKAQYAEAVLEQLPDETQDELLKRANRLDQRMLERGERRFGELLLDVMDSLDRPTDDNGKRRAYLGIRDVDDVLGGMMPGEVCVLAGLTGRGKTCLAMQAAAHNCKRGRVAVVFSLEMSRDALIRRVAAAEARVDLGRMFSGQLDRSERQRLVEASNHMGSWNLDLRTQERTIKDIRAALYGLREHHGEIDFVVVDYLQMIQHPDSKASLHVRAVDNSRGIMSLARELDVPIVLLSQLNREAVKESTPRRHHLRDSGTIEQDADQILLVYDAPSGFVPPAGATLSPGETWMTIDVAKNRRGPETMLTVAWNRPHQRFYDPVADDQLAF